MIKRITSMQHPLVKHLVKLKRDSAYRHEKQMLVVEGSKPINEICQGQRATTLLVEESYEIPPEINAETIVIATRDILSKISSMKNPEGILAEVRCPPFVNFTGKKHILALAGLSDPGNMGTLLRTALALGWDGAFILEDSVDPFNDKAVRASRGAIFRLPLMKGTWQDLDLLSKSNRLPIIIADIQGTPIDAINIPAGCILVLGNESKGPITLNSEEHAKITIPMPGDMESLNVAIAGGILMYLIRGQKIE